MVVVEEVVTVAEEPVAVEAGVGGEARLEAVEGGAEETLLPPLLLGRWEGDCGLWLVEVVVMRGWVGLGLG